MVEIAKELHFSKSSQAEHGMIKRGDFLNRYLLTRRLMERRTEMY